MKQQKTLAPDDPIENGAGRPPARFIGGRRHRQRNPRFGELEPALQKQEFFNWLPAELHNAPGIDWTALPSRVMGYLVRQVGNSPDAPLLAVAAGATVGAVADYGLLQMIGQLNVLLRTIRQVCNIEQVAELKQKQVWQDFATKTAMKPARFLQLATYSVVSGKYIPGYLERLAPVERQSMRQYALPGLPHGFLRQHGGKAPLTAAAKSSRKAKSDVLVPLYPVLRQLERFRKQLAERTFKAIREARRQVENGEASLPFSFQHTDIIPSVNRDARTIADVEIQGGEVTMHFTLWDKRSWILNHVDRFGPTTVKDARDGVNAYSQEQNKFFVQFHGPPSDLLWFGELVEHGVFQHFIEHKSIKDEYRRRWQFARSIGFSHGCTCSRPRLLDPGDQWFGKLFTPGELYFEPESLYRGVLYGAALAMISLSNGSRVNELLQVSWNQERRVTRVETIAVLGENGQALIGADGRTVTRQEKIHLQHLLPKGAKTDEERQLFPLSKEAVRLLGEIKRGLEEVHGTIPVVHPPLDSTKYEHLKPEQYFFQWAASPEGLYGMLRDEDVQVLLRFVLHGLELTTMQGEPIRVTAHLLRHVMATDARQYRHVPAETIAHFFLHHRLRASLGRSPSPSEVSNYYFQMTEAERLAIIREDLDEQEEMDSRLVLTVPTTRDLEQMNEDLRAAYDQWQSLHPTAFGYCGCPGLCPRGYNRSLCIGCPFLITDPTKLGAALAWRESYARQAENLDAQCNYIDARQARIVVQQLDDLVNVMHLQMQAEADGGYVPLFKVLPRQGGQKENTHA